MSVLDQIEALDSLIDGQEDDNDNLDSVLRMVRATLVKFSQPLNTVFVGESCTEFDIVGLGNLFRGIRNENDTPVLFVDGSAARAASNRMELVTKITNNLADLDLNQLRSVESAINRANDHPE